MSAKYLCFVEGEGPERVEITADSAKEAARKYLKGGDWFGDDDWNTTLVDVSVASVDNPDAWNIYTIKLTR
jgi:hypothetical protein